MRGQPGPEFRTSSSVNIERAQQAHLDESTNQDGAGLHVTWSRADRSRRYSCVAKPVPAPTSGGHAHLLWHTEGAYLGMHTAAWGWMSTPVDREHCRGAVERLHSTDDNAKGLINPPLWEELIGKGTRGSGGLVNWVQTQLPLSEREARTD